MNMLFLPSFHECVIAPEVTHDDDIVSFNLTSGVVILNCQVQAKQLKRCVEVASYFAPERGHDHDYVQLEVSTDLTVNVVDSYLAPEAVGRQIKLTRQQVEQLNQQLEYLAEEELEMELAA